MSDYFDPPPPNFGLGPLSIEEMARRADALLSDPLLKGVLDEMDSEAVMTWRRSQNPAQREDAWMRVTVIADMRGKLRSAIDNLKMRATRDRLLRVSRDLT